MSTSIYWRPKPKELKDSYLGYELKWHLRSLWGHDGSLGSEWITVDKDLIPYLRGIESAGDKNVSKQARKLIGLIEKHNEVQIKLEG